MADGQVRVLSHTWVDWPQAAHEGPQGRLLLAGQDPPHGPPGLQQALAAQPSLVRRCVLALPESACLIGQLPWPADAAEDLLEADILLEAAQALKLPLTSIGYDFGPAAWQEPGAGPPPGPGEARCNWGAAALDTLSQWRRSLRAAGLRLQAVEPQEQAARRALAMIEGEEAALWRQAPQDWRFRPAEASSVPLAQPWPDMQALRADARVKRVWPQLVACGLALRCWQEDSSGALDLLQRPVQVRRRRLHKRLLWTLTMSCLGASLAWAGVQARLQDVPELQQQLAQAQALVRQQTREQRARQDLLEALQQLAAQQKMHEQLQRAQQEDAQVLQALADLLPSGVVLERLVFERGRVEWQGHAPSQQVLHEVHARLNRQDALPWTLVRTEQTAGGAEAARPGVRFTLHRAAPPEAAP